MRFLVTQERLNKALSHTARIATNHQTLPILANVLLRAKQNRLEVISTNLEQAIIETLTGKIEEEGEITIPSRLITDFISSIPQGETIFVEKKENHVTLVSGRFSAKLNGTPSDEFPQIPSVEGDQTINVDSTRLKKSLQNTIFAASKDVVRQILTGVILNTEEDELFIAATDSYRLAEDKVCKTDQQITSVLPANSLSELLRVIEEDGKVEIRIDKTQAMFTYEDTTIVTRVIEGEYPKYKQLIPKQSDINVIINKKDFLEAVKIAGLFAKENAGGIKISADSKENKLNVSSIASQIGDNHSYIDAEIDNSGEVTLNSRYLIDCLNSLSGEEVLFRFSGKLSPCVITSTDQNSTQTQLIMPLKT